MEQIYIYRSCTLHVLTHEAWAFYRSKKPFTPFSYFSPAAAAAAAPPPPPRGEAAAYGRRLWINQRSQQTGRQNKSFIHFCARERACPLTSLSQLKLALADVTLQTADVSRNSRNNAYARLIDLSRIALDRAANQRQSCSWLCSLIGGLPAGSVETCNHTIMSLSAADFRSVPSGSLDRRLDIRHKHH